MKPVFDENGLATEPGNIRCFYYGPETGEYSGWSDEYINLGVSMPGYSTDKDPGDEVSGKVAVFTDGEWTQEEDHRGETVYSITDAKASTVDYIGPINAGYTSISPSGPYQKWNGKTWVTDADAKQVADVAAAEQKKASLIANAQVTISLWQTELQLGLISDEDKASLIAWMKYIKAVQAVDTSKAPDIIWPDKPE
ncbi:phage tail assembly chaperone gp38 [Enterobacter hormaechei]|uniref:tail fiber assembly protein n=1 Tax=Enterobacter cloacae complex TaxID=354276 RepID=UPI0007922F23|nr:MULTISPECIES: tail fiber assembly protein [Enterobacter cloacae complex]MCK6819661.1 tail fiber assembly protein [Enterobacter chengduensis]MDP0436502.1 tail fiber assembly protein [Enterobacter hormaechei]RSK55059.1 tail fiber assembly protein [Enterobacter chengduensis]CZW01803.1 phage tail assembly chaperone gp38 [Enterobacter hormaechei]CZW03820.1 phage tail assembly chaperone gp38 [Enterobacter hormaechei]